MLSFLLLLLLAACSGGPQKPDRDSVGPDSDADTDTDTDTDADADPGETANWAITRFEVGGRNDGFDLDGDGDTENALWVTGALLDPLIATGMDNAQRLTALQLAGIQDWQEDDALQLGLLLVSDTDGDPSDNGSGTEIFDAGAQIDAQGQALVSYPTSLSGGSYELSFATSTLVIGGLDIDTSTDVFIAGTPTSSTHVGRIGFGVEATTLITALSAVGASEELIRVLSGLADLDMDQDGTPETISSAFAYEGQSCGVE